MKIIKLGKLCKVFLPLFILLLTFTAWADDSGLLEEEVVVTATRTSQSQLESPGMTEVITKEEIQDSGANTLSEVLTDAGLTVSSYGGACSSSNIQIDGSSSEQTLILINGVSANTNTLGSLDINLFPASVIKKVEVVHGPLSALYGANALGGVVNIITGLTGTPVTNIEFGGGTFNSKYSNSMIQQEKWGFMFGGATTDGHRDNSETDTKYFAWQYDFLQEENEYLTLNLLMMERSGGSPGSLSWLSPQAKLDEANYSFNLGGKNQWLNGSWEYKLFRQYSKYDYTNPDTSEYTTHESDDYGLDLAGLYLLEEHELLTGIILKREDFDSTISNHHTRKSGGLFFQDTWHLAEQWRLVPGVRWDTASGYSSPLSPRVNLVYLPSENLSLKIGYGKAFRAPTVNDLYWDQPSYGMYGNKDLKPEKAGRYDLVGEWRKGPQALVANLFHAEVKDAINWAAIDPSDPLSDWTVKNVDKIEIDGITLRWEKNWANRFSLKTGYNYLDKKGWNETTRSYSNPLNLFGKNRIFMDFGFTISKLKLNLNWQQITDRQQETVIMSNYDLLNFGATYTLTENLLFKLAVYNVTNEEYEIQNGYPMPEREYKLSATYSF